MKAIAIIEVPEGGKGKWYIDGEIRYTENESLMKKFDVEMIPLRPLPPKLDANDWHRMFSGLFSEREAKGYGWNVCLDVITGETE